MHAKKKSKSSTPPPPSFPSHLLPLLPLSLSSSFVLCLFFSVLFNSYRRSFSFLVVICSISCCSSFRVRLHPHMFFLESVLLRISHWLSPFLCTSIFLPDPRPPSGFYDMFIFSWWICHGRSKTSVRFQHGSVSSACYNIVCVFRPSTRHLRTISTKSNTQSVKRRRANTLSCHRAHTIEHIQKF